MQSGLSDRTFDGIVAVAGRGGNEIDRSGGGESFAAMRHLNWLNADKLQRYTHSVAPAASPRVRAFSALFPGDLAIAAAWKTRHLEVSYRTYVRDPPWVSMFATSTSRLQ